MNCQKQNCPYQFKHSHGILALVFPRGPKKNPALEKKLDKIMSSPNASISSVMDELMGSIGPIGRIIYDVVGTGEQAMVSLMVGPIKSDDYQLGAQRESVILEPGCSFQVDRHDYSKPVNRSRGKCTICKQTWNKCTGHSPVKEEAAAESGMLKALKISAFVNVNSLKNRELGVHILRDAAQMVGLDLDVRVTDGEYVAILKCKCGTKNRVWLERPGDAVCGKCKEAL